MFNPLILMCFPYSGTRHTRCKGLQLVGFCRSRDFRHFPDHTHLLLFSCGGAHTHIVVFHRIVGTSNICCLYGGDTAWNGGDFPALLHNVYVHKHKVVCLCNVFSCSHRIAESCVFQRCMIDTHDSSSDHLLAYFTYVNNVMWRVLMGFLLGFHSVLHSFASLFLMFSSRSFLAF
jgi:hypothetical protein